MDWNLLKTILWMRIMKINEQSFESVSKTLRMIKWKCLEVELKLGNVKSSIICIWKYSIYFNQRLKWLKPIKKYNFITWKSYTTRKNLTNLILKTFKNIVTCRKLGLWKWKRDNSNHGWLFISRTNQIF